MDHKKESVQGAEKVPLFRTSKGLRTIGAPNSNTLDDLFLFPSIGCRGNTKILNSEDSWKKNLPLKANDVYLRY